VDTEAGRGERGEDMHTFVEGTSTVQKENRPWLILSQQKTRVGRGEGKNLLLGDGKKNSNFLPERSSRRILFPS